MSKEKTLNYKGEKQVNLISHTGAQFRLSCCLTITSNGEKLSTVVIMLYKYKNKKGEFRDFPKKLQHWKNRKDPIMLRFNPTGFNNENILNEWYDKIIIPYHHRLKMRGEYKLVLLLDDAKFHGNQKMRDKCKLNNIDLIIIPGGTTGILQPLDVVIHKPLKDHLRKLYAPWLSSQCLDESNLTKKGYLSPPKPEKLLEWIEKSSCRNTKSNDLNFLFENWY